MKNSISEQIKGVQEAIRLLKILSHPMEERDWEMAEMLANSTITILNDAGSTLAALNLTKDLPEKEDYFGRLYVLLERYMTTPYEHVEGETEQEILAMSYDRLKLQEDRIKELEEALKNLIYTADSIWQDEAKRIIPSDSITFTHPIIEEAKSLLKQ